MLDNTIIIDPAANTAGDIPVLDPTTYVGFLIPVVKGKIVLGQRKTPPYAGFFGAMGGKAEKDKERRGTHGPHLVTKQGGHKVKSIADCLAEDQGREYPSETAVREFCEEAFVGKTYPADFQAGEIRHVVKLGYIQDEYNGRPQCCYFHVAILDRDDFSLGREIAGIRPLADIPLDKIFPLTQIALTELKHRMTGKHFPTPVAMRPYRRSKLDQQIPDFPDTPYRRSNMLNVIMDYSERGLTRLLV